MGIFVELLLYLNNKRKKSTLLWKTLRIITQKEISMVICVAKLKSAFNLITLFAH